MTPADCMSVGKALSLSGPQVPHFLDRRLAGVGDGQDNLGRESCPKEQSGCLSLLSLLLPPLSGQAPVFHRLSPATPASTPGLKVGVLTG